METSGIIPSCGSRTVRQGLAARRGLAACENQNRGGPAGSRWAPGSVPAGGASRPAPASAPPGTTIRGSIRTMASAGLGPSWPSRHSLGVPWLPPEGARPPAAPLCHPGVAHVPAPVLSERGILGRSTAAQHPGVGFAGAVGAGGGGTAGTGGAPHHRHTPPSAAVGQQAQHTGSAATVGTSRSLLAGARGAVQRPRGAGLPCRATRANAATAGPASDGPHTHYAPHDVMTHGSHNIGVLEPTFVLLFGVCNRVLYKMALVPLHYYPIALGSGLTIAYSLVYSAILFARYRAKLVTKEMLAYPRTRFLLIGALDAVGLVLGNVGAAGLPGVLIPVLSQTVLFWQLAFSVLLLKKTFSSLQVVGVALVAVGVALAAVQPGLSPLESSILSGVAQENVGLYLASVALPALSAVAKEQAFAESTRALGRPLDIFVVNSYSSIIQAVCVLLLFPLVYYFKGGAVSDLPTYFVMGFKCFFGLTPEARAAGAPITPLLYLAVNVAFSISILRFLRTHGSMLSTVLWSMIMPLSIWAFTLDLPFIGPAPKLGAVFYLGVLILCAGVVTYSEGRSRTEVASSAAVSAAVGPGQGPGQPATSVSIEDSEMGRPDGGPGPHDPNGRSHSPGPPGPSPDPWGNGSPGGSGGGGNGGGPPKPPPPAPPPPPAAVVAAGRGRGY